MRRAPKITAFVLCFLLVFSAFAQVNAFAKAKAMPVKAKMVKVAVKSKTVKTVKAAVTKTKAVKVVPKGLAKGKKNGAKSPLPPVIKQGGVLIPVYAITRSYGAEVTYDAVSHEVTITKGSTVIVINMDKKTALVNGTEFKLTNEGKDSSGMIVPLDFIAEKLGITTTTGATSTTDGTTTGTTTTGTTDGTTTGTGTTGTTDGTTAGTTTTGTTDGTTTGSTTTAVTGIQTTTTGSGSTTASAN